MVSTEIAVWLSTGAAVIWQLGWVEGPPKGGSVTGLARRCWLLAGGPASLPHRHLHRLLECPQNKNLRDHHRQRLHTMSCDLAIGILRTPSFLQYPTSSAGL